jgi:metal-responsive CopG/Arc/MetJ family transcriptional regulator
MINALNREGGKGEVKRTQSESKRIQFEFSADALERMERLRERTHARSYAELIRDALRAYEWMVEEKEAGHDVGAIKGKEIVNVVKLLF